MGKNIIVGTRGSKLAVIQTETVVEKIKAIYPDLNIVIQKVMTTGDKNHDISLDHIGVAVFVRELEDALLNKRIDLAVHSLKDMPSIINLSCFTVAMAAIGALHPPCKSCKKALSAVIHLSLIHI